MHKIDENIFYNLNRGVEKNRIEDLLVEDESILWRGKPNKKAYILSSVTKMLPVVIIWLLFDITIAIFAFGTINNLFILLFLICFFALHLLPVWIWLFGIIKSVKEIKNIEYAFTENKIIIKSGFIGIDFKIINYADITGVDCKVGFTDKLFHVGDIYINSVLNKVVLNDLTNPYEIYRILQQISIDIKSDIIYPNAFRPIDNPGYKTKYRNK